MVDDLLRKLVERLLDSGLEIVKVSRLCAIDAALDPPPQEKVVINHTRNLKHCTTYLVFDDDSSFQMHSFWSTIFKIDEIFCGAVVF